jgi:hypothetical protein
MNKFATGSASLTWSIGGKCHAGFERTKLGMKTKAEKKDAGERVSCKRRHQAKERKNLKSGIAFAKPDCSDLIWTMIL